MAAVAETPEPNTATPEPTANPLPLAPDADPVTLDGTPKLKDTGNWINTEPFTLAEQRELGNVVLIHFWTYTCVNCIRTLPFLREWHSKYSDRGLTILGVHTSEFEFEKITDNV